MIPLRDELASRLERLERDGLRRRLALPSGVDFSSNDYLGLSRDPELRRRLLERLANPAAVEALGAPASRLLRGHLEAHERLEERLAAFKGTEAALLFATGYQANLGVLTALIGPGDRVLSDELNHASIIDGLRLTRARKVIFPHLDVAALASLLAEPHAGGRTFIVTESLFSMEGDAAPLERYADLAERHGAELIADDAHATGLFGAARGSGLLEELGVARRAIASVSTCGKALGFSGAFAAGPRVVIDYLVQAARPFIFTTALPPLVVEALDVALDLLQAEPGRRRRVLELARRLRDGLRRQGLEGPAPAGPIVPVVLGENHRAVAAAARLRERGYDVRAIRPPSVPPGTARLRISVHAHNSEEEVDGLVRAAAEVFQREALR